MSGPRTPLSRYPLFPVTSTPFAGIVTPFLGIITPFSNRSIIGQRFIANLVIGLLFFLYGPIPAFVGSFIEAVVSHVGAHLAFVLSLGQQNLWVDSGSGSFPNV